MSKKVVNMETIKGYAGLTKKALESKEPKELKTISKDIDAYVSANKETIESSLAKKLNVRVNWIESLLDDATDQVIMDIFEDETKTEKVASEKKVIKKNKDKKTNKTTDSADKNKNKKDTNKTTKTDSTNKSKDDKKTTKKTTLEPHEFTTITPDKKHYIRIKDNAKSLFQIIYLNATDDHVVLLDSQGVIDCSYDDFKDGFVCYEYNGSTYSFKIIESYVA